MITFAVPWNGEVFKFLNGEFYELIFKSINGEFYELNESLNL